MKLSEQLKDIQNQYNQVGYDNGLELLPCHKCKHPETKHCLRCEECGRKFENGKLVKEVK